MAEFKNKEEYDKWKTQRLKNISDKGKEIKHAKNDVSVQDKKGGSKKLKSISIISILFISLLSYLYYYYSYSYQPKKLAEDYLQAIRLHDFEKIHKLDPYGKNILINLIDWKFIYEKRVPSKKHKLNLSDDEYKKDIEHALKFWGVSSIENLSDHYKNYENWCSFSIEATKSFEENGNYYYTSNHWIEYLLDITTTNKLGTELKKKYLLQLEIEGGKCNLDGKWKVAYFEERE